jgi:hypothetical protein
MTTDLGWQWFDGSLAALQQKEAAPDEPTLPIAFARCFSTPEGRRVLRHLRGCTLERSLGPSATDAQLRHLEGQRQLVAHIVVLIAQGSNQA